MLSNASQMILSRLKTQRELDSSYDSITMYDNLEKNLMERMKIQQEKIGEN